MLFEKYLFAFIISLVETIHRFPLLKKFQTKTKMLVKVCFISIFVLIQAWMLGVSAEDQLIRRREVMIIDDAAGATGAIIQENKFPLSRQAATTKFDSEDEEVFGMTRVETRHLHEGKGGKGGAAGKGGKGAATGKGGKGDDDGKGGKGGSKGGSKGGEDAGKSGKGGSKGGAKGASKGKGKIKEKRQKIAKRTPQVRIKSKLPQPRGSE